MNFLPGVDSVDHTQRHGQGGESTNIHKQNVGRSQEIRIKQ